MQCTAVLAVLFGIVAVSPTASGINIPRPALTNKTFRRLSMQDVVLTESLLAEVPGTSKVSCGQQCVAAEGCVMFTFLPGQNVPSGICRLYDHLPYSTAGQQNWPGARSYAFRAGSDYSLACGHYVKLVTTSLNFSQVRQNCEDQEHGRLLVIHILQEITCIYDFIATKGVLKKLLWVGVDWEATTGRYLWFDGTELPVGSDLWGPDQPEKRGGDDCMVIHYWSYKVHDHYCRRREFSMCEQVL